jgi:hypothetical protein
VQDNSIVGQRIAGPKFVFYRPEFSNYRWTKVSAATAFEDSAPTQLPIGYYGNRHSSRFTNFLSHPLENHPAQIDTRNALLQHQNLSNISAMPKSYRDVQAWTNQAKVEGWVTARRGCGLPARRFFENELNDLLHMDDMSALAKSVCFNNMWATHEHLVAAYDSLPVPDRKLLIRSLRKWRF